MTCDTADTQDDPCMLDAPIAVVQLGAHGPDTGLQQLADHFGKPLARDHFGVVVQKAHHVTGRPFNGVVVDGRVVERTLVADDSKPVVTGVQIFEGGQRPTGVVDDNHLEIGVCRGVQQAVDAPVEEPSVPGRDDNAHPRGGIREFPAHLVVT